MMEIKLKSKSKHYNFEFPGEYYLVEDASGKVYWELPNKHYEPGVDDSKYVYRGLECYTHTQDPSRAGAPGFARNPVSVRYDYVYSIPYFKEHGVKEIFRWSPEKANMVEFYAGVGAEEAAAILQAAKDNRATYDSVVNAAPQAESDAKLAQGIAAFISSTQEKEEVLSVKGKK